MRGQFIFIFLSLLLLSPLINAEQESLGLFKQGECVPIIQICGDCTYVNISSVLINNIEGSKLIIINEEMTKTGPLYNYSFCNTTTLGEYNVNGIGDPKGIIEPYAYNWYITPTGKDFELG